MCSWQCFQELYLASILKLYEAERSFSLNIFFSRLWTHQGHCTISCVFFLPGPTLTIEGTCIQLSSGVRIF